MGKIKMVLFAVMAILGLGVLAPALPAFAESAVDEVVKISEELSARAEEIFAEESEDLEIVAGQFKEYSSVVRDAVIKLQAIDVNAGHKEKINDMASALTRMANYSETMASTITDKDETAYREAYDGFILAEEDLEVASDAYDQYLKDNPLESGDSTYATWYIVLIVSIVCLVIALAVFFACRGQNGVVNASQVDAKTGKTKETTLKKMRLEIVIASIVFVVGAAIPAVQYYIAVHSIETGGEFEYYIFWYPLALGAIWFVIALPNYFIQLAKLKKSGGLRDTDDATAVALEQINALHQNEVRDVANNDQNS